MEKHIIDQFVEQLILFVEDDYLNPSHNFNRDLKYSVREIDEHYNCQYRDLFDNYYKDFVVLKEEGFYSTLTIIYNGEADDYFFEVAQEQMVGAMERKEERIKELDEILEKEMKLLEEGKIDEVSPATFWIFGIDKDKRDS